MPRRYPPEFRRKVLDLLKSGRTVADVASGRAVTEQTIYNWRNQGLVDTGQKPGLSSDCKRDTLQLGRNVDRKKVVRQKFSNNDRCTCGNCRRAHYRDGFVVALRR